MKSALNKRRKKRSCPYEKQHGPFTKNISKYVQGCNLLLALELNQRQSLSKKCLGNNSLIYIKNEKD